VEKYFNYKSLSLNFLSPIHLKRKNPFPYFLLAGLGKSTVSPCPKRVSAAHPVGIAGGEEVYSPTSNITQSKKYFHSFFAFR